VPFTNHGKWSLTLVTSRADEWNVNKWAWEGALKVASKGEECVIKLEDKSTGTVTSIGSAGHCLQCL
jgi:hypothetical protein